LAALLVPGATSCAFVAKAARERGVGSVSGPVLVAATHKQPSVSSRAPTPRPPWGQVTQVDRGLSLYDAHYVAATGNDAAPGTQAQPWRTLQHAVDTAMPGEEILIESGNYAGFRMTRSGTAAAPIGLAAAPGAFVDVDGPLAAGDVVDLAGVHDVSVRGLTVRNAHGDWRAGILVRDGATRIHLTNDVVNGNSDFGVRIVDSTNVEVAGDDISHNAAGIIVERAGAGVHIDHDVVHDNDRMIVDDPAPDNDTGAMGINFQFSTGPVLADHNIIYGNRAQSDDYGYDGSGFEIYGASNVSMLDNVLFDDEAVMETGTDSLACTGNRFEGNVAWGPHHATVDVHVPQSNGLLLRCATDMVVTHNTLYDLDAFAVWFDASDSHTGNVNGLSVTGNLFVQPAVSPVYELDSPVPNTATVDGNDIMASGPMLARIVGHDAPTDLAQLQSATEFEAHGVSVAPGFASASTFDLRATNASVIGRYGAA
jgi:hypothetical protein